MSEQGKTGVRVGLFEGDLRLPAKVARVIESRKVWAGEIDGTRAVEAMTWVLGIFIGSVALEDGMTRLFASLASAVAGRETGEAANHDEEESSGQP